LLQTLSPLLLQTNEQHKLLEIFRADEKSKFWRVIEGAAQCPSERERRSMFFTKVLADANSVGERLDLEKLDFTKEREHAFETYLKARFLNAAVNVTWKGYSMEEQAALEDDNQDCQFCKDGFADFWCNDCEMYLCDDCKDNPSGDHQLTHAIKELDLDDDTEDID